MARIGPVGLTLALGTGTAAIRLWWLARAVDRAQRIAGAVTAFERRGAPGRPGLLVAGDSLAVGVGAASPDRSVAGRIAAACPGLVVENRARSGARVADVPAQLAGASRAHWDAILVAIGGNDALAGTPAPQLRDDADRMLAQACRAAPRVIVATAANLGSIPILPWPLARWFDYRSRRVRDELRRACERHPVALVDFHRPLASDVFARDPVMYFGEDRVHPSSAAYELCYRVIERRTGLAAALRAASAGPAG